MAAREWPRYRRCFIPVRPAEGIESRVGLAVDVVHWGFIPVRPAEGIESDALAGAQESIISRASSRYDPLRVLKVKAKAQAKLNAAALHPGTTR